MGKTQLIKIFKKKYNTTPMKYAQGQRIVAAKYHLRVTNSSISRLSEMFCFADSKYFSNVFKTYVGVSPQEYRTHHRGDGVKDEIAFHHDDFVKLVPEKRMSNKKTG
jgi:AraC-like DNA-binding protein